MPYPSSACQTCKIRRIKCDETKPICRRCSKSKRVCLDSKAVQQASFSIHVENDFASGIVKRPRGPRSRMTVLSPHFDLHARAVAYYLQYHLQSLKEVPNLIKGVSECVTVWKNAGKSCTMVDLALSSLALVVYAKTQQHPAAAREAFSRYNSLLRVAQGNIARLESPRLDDEGFDACLLATSLMSRYEGATLDASAFFGSEIFPFSQKWFHHDGVKAILKVWTENSDFNTPTFIVKQTRRELIKSSVLRDLPIPDWMQDGSRFGESDRELDYDHIIVKIANLNHAVATLKQESLCTKLAGKLNSEARELDEALQDWNKNIPGPCFSNPHHIPDAASWPRKHFYSRTVYSYPKAAFSSAWCQNFALSMIINNARYKILGLSQRRPSTQLTFEKERDECISRLEASANNIASSIPFCLERFTVDSPGMPECPIKLNPDAEVKPYLARLILWPLLVVLGVQGVNSVLRSWFRQELISIGEITGDGIIECAKFIGSDSSENSIADENKSSELTTISFMSS